MEIRMNFSGVMPVERFRQPGKPLRPEVEEPAIEFLRDFRSTRTVARIMPLVFAPTVMQKREDGDEGLVGLKFFSEQHAIRQNCSPVSWAVDAPGAKREAGFGFPEQSIGIHILQLIHVLADFCLASKAKQEVFSSSRPQYHSRHLTCASAHKGSALAQFDRVSTFMIDFCGSVLYSEHSI